MVLVQVAVIM
jgi:hypothetical protein